MTTRITKIGSFGRVITGKTPPTKSVEYYGGSYPFITPTDISEDSIFVERPERYLSESGALKIGSSKVPKNAILYTCIASIGKIAIAKTESFTNQQINSVIVDSDKADFRYVFYLLRHITSQIKSMAGGAASPIINKSAFENIDVEVLALSDQKKVSDILFVYDSIIENNNRLIKILEQMAQAIYTEWFVNFRFPGHEKAKSKKNRLPDGWEVKKLRDVISFYIGGGWGEENQSDDFSIPGFVIRGTDIPMVTKGDISTVPFRFHKESNMRSRKAELLDIVFEVSGGSKGQPVGRHALLTGRLLQSFSENVIFASFCKLIRVNKTIVSPYSVSLLFNKLYREEIISKYQVQSTGISNFRFEDFIDEVSVLIPDEGTRRNFDEIVENIFVLMQEMGIKNTNLKKSRDLLLPKLVIGKVRV